MGKQNKRRTLTRPEELSEETCACGWRLPIVGLRFDDPSNRPDYATLRALLRGVVIQIDCPHCSRVHDDPVGEPAATAPQTPIRTIPCAAKCGVSPELEIAA